MPVGPSRHQSARYAATFQNHAAPCIPAPKRPRYHVPAAKIGKQIERAALVPCLLARRKFLRILDSVPLNEVPQFLLSFGNQPSLVRLNDPFAALFLQPGRVLGIAFVTSVQSCQPARRVPKLLRRVSESTCEDAGFLLRRRVEGRFGDNVRGARFGLLSRRESRKIRAVGHDLNSPTLAGRPSRRGVGVPRRDRSESAVSAAGVGGSRCPLFYRSYKLSLIHYWTLAVGVVPEIPLRKDPTSSRLRSSPGCPPGSGRVGRATRPLSRPGPRKYPLLGFRGYARRYSTRHAAVQCLYLAWCWVAEWGDCRSGGCGFESRRPR